MIWASVPIPIIRLINLRTMILDKNMATVQVESKLVKIQPDLAQSSEARPHQTAQFDGFLLWFPLSFAVVWAIARLFHGRFADFIFRRPKLGWNKANFKHSGNVPCRSCRYFTNSLYLKCTVHPTTVMTQAAINCSDYHML